jgi:DNA-binding response OmpR family regulator
MSWCRKASDGVAVHETGRRLSTPSCDGEEDAVPTRSSPLRPQPTDTLWRRGILVLDDDAIARRTICAIADRAGWASITAPSFAEAESLLGTENFGCIVTDVTVEGIPVDGFLHTLADLCYTAPVLLVGAGGAALRNAAADLAFRLGLNICHPIAKPIELATLAIRLSRIDTRLQAGFTGCCSRDCHWHKAAEVEPEAPARAAE